MTFRLPDIPPNSNHKPNLMTHRSVAVTSTRRRATARFNERDTSNGLVSLNGDVDCR